METKMMDWARKLGRNDWSILKHQIPRNITAVAKPGDHHRWSLQFVFLQDSQLKWRSRCSQSCARVCRSKSLGSGNSMNHSHYQKFQGGPFLFSISRDATIQSKHISFAIIQFDRTALEWLRQRREAASRTKIQRWTFHAKKKHKWWFHNALLCVGLRLKNDLNKTWQNTHGAALWTARLEPHVVGWPSLRFLFIPWALKYSVFFWRYIYIYIYNI